MAIFFFKMLHIIGFVSWFAGLFYIVRLFVYHVEARQKPSPEKEILTGQYQLMQRRLYKIIMNPAMMLTWLAGLAMILLYGWEWFKINYWLHVKLVFLCILTGYHLYCGKIVTGGKKIESMNSFQYRIFNECPTVILVIITALAVYRQQLNYYYLFGGIIIFIILLIWGLYKSKRQRIKYSENSRGN